ncbi:flagellar protein FlaG [Pseudomonas putida]|uniref:flagellar protein FlaG n=1 Tax=Pseudomonas TaxID=286 RepID=UPI00105A50AD|nr:MULTISPECIES: flagellar protein FlaG [Pseudomonas]MCT8166359.1 flagellar protein FlaG [Pseudomonas sp. HD6422]MCT8185201.1 flagellar protein FlaG [Pseudomonas sp. HD6421]TDJ76657.1 flagellar protein FlaG [Pseudomonas putida]
MDMNVDLKTAYPAGLAPASASQNGVKATQTKDSSDVQGTEPERAQLEQAVSDIQDYVSKAQRNLEFSIDDTTHKVVVKVIATESGDVIRQIPSETVLMLAQRLQEGGTGLFDEMV